MLSTSLGFYYVMFQRGLNPNFVKCWIDGSTDYIFNTVEDMLDMLRQAGNPKLTSLFNNCINTTSLYLWDVDNNRIIPINNTYESTSSNEKIQSKKDRLLNERQVGDNLFLNPSNPVNYNNGQIKIDLS